MADDKNTNYIVNLLVTVISVSGVVSGSMISQGNQTIGWVLMSVFGLFAIASIVFMIFKLKNYGGFDIDFDKYLTHDVFRKISQSKNWVKNKFIINNPVKQAIFEDILINTLNIYTDQLKDLIKFLKSCRTASELNSKIDYMVEDIINKITVYYQYNDTKYTSEDKETLRIVISKFLGWHSPRLYSVKECLSEIITDTEFYGDNINDKIPYILSHFESLIIGTLTDSKMVLSRLNGEIKEKTFNDKKVGV